MYLSISKVFPVICHDMPNATNTSLVASILLEIFVFRFQDKTFLYFLYSSYLSGAFYFYDKIETGTPEKFAENSWAQFVLLLENTQR